YNGYRITQDMVPAGQCVRIIWSGKQVELPPQCDGKVHYSEQLVTPAKFFWRKETDTDAVISTFAVLYEGREIARCDTVERGGDAECRFNWPVSPTPVPAAGS
ncbi:MAG: hypothetical protein KC496_19350, partial [Anaerolineae bacterium]|nr:hypothetical protein [Anaerolineae bacterium]